MKVQNEGIIQFFSKLSFCVSGLKYCSQMILRNSVGFSSILPWDIKGQGQQFNNSTFQCIILFNFYL